MKVDLCTAYPISIMIGHTVKVNHCTAYPISIMIGHTVKVDHPMIMVSMATMTGVKVVMLQWKSAPHSVFTGFNLACTKVDIHINP